MEVNLETLSHVKASKIFKPNASRIKSIDIHKVDNFMISTGDDDVIHVYNIDQGTSLNVVNSQKYGASHACFTHHNQSVIHASTKGEDLAIRYLSLFDNRYLRYFSGHTKPITSLCMNPINDMFMSASKDKTVRLWELRSEKCLGICTTPSEPCAAFDYQGLIYAVASENGAIKMFDLKEYHKGPFAKFMLRDQEFKTNNPVTCLKFSYDGFKLIAVVEDTVYVLNAFTGDLINKFNTGLKTPQAQKQNNEQQQPIEAPFKKFPKEAALSPDGKYLLSGCDDCVIRIWEVDSQREVCKLEGVHTDVPTQLKWVSNKYMIASAFYGITLWTPDLQSLPPKYLPQQYKPQSEVKMEVNGQENQAPQSGGHFMSNGLNSGDPQGIQSGEQSGN